MPSLGRLAPNPTKDHEARRVRAPASSPHEHVTKNRTWIWMLEKDVTFALQGQGRAYQVLHAESQTCPRQ